jgi:hypothetical protein
MAAVAEEEGVCIVVAVVIKESLNTTKNFACLQQMLLWVTCSHYAEHHQY